MGPEEHLLQDSRRGESWFARFPSGERIRAFLNEWKPVHDEWSHMIRKDQSLTKAWRATPFHEKKAAPYLRAHSAALCYSKLEIRERQQQHNISWL